MRVSIILFLLSMQILCIYPSTLPKLVRCHITDSLCLGSLTRELLQTFILGIPDLGVGSFDPMKLGSLLVHRDNMIYELLDINVKGIKDLVVDDFSVDLKKNFSHTIFHTDLIMTGLYRVNGSYLFSPICGEGDFHLTFKNTEFEIFQKFNVVKNDNGIDYIDAKEYVFRFEVKDNARLDLSNLFFGDQFLSDEMHELINSNWKYLAAQYGEPLMNKAIDNLLASINKVLELVPLKIFVEY